MERLYKIGFTRKPLEQRLAGLEKENGFIKGAVHLAMAFQVACGHGAERYLHNRFDRRWRDREFFDLQPEDLKALEGFTSFNDEPTTRVR